jgi:hypothetical protein
MIVISIHFVIICDVLLWRTYETHPALSFKSRCDIARVHYCVCVWGVGILKIPTISTFPNAPWHDNHYLHGPRFCYFLFLSWTTTWGFEVLVCVIPIICQYLLAKYPMFPVFVVCNSHMYMNPAPYSSS